jgi:hypothetical protein
VGPSRPAFRAGMPFFVIWFVLLAWFTSWLNPVPAGEGVAAAAGVHRLGPVGAGALPGPAPGVARRLRHDPPGARAHRTVHLPVFRCRTRLAQLRLRPGSSAPRRPSSTRRDRR